MLSWYLQMKIIRWPSWPTGLARGTREAKVDDGLRRQRSQSLKVDTVVTLSVLQSSADLGYVPSRPYRDMCSCICLFLR